MNTGPRVDLGALEMALMWVSSDAEEVSACVSRETGEVFQSPFDGEGEEDWPADADDTSRYCQVPHQREFHLGKQLVFRFVDEKLPGLRREVEEVFRRPGAYRRWSDLLDAQGQRDAWHEYRDAATREALREWATDEGFVVVEQARALRAG